MENYSISSALRLSVAFCYRRVKYASVLITLRGTGCHCDPDKKLQKLLAVTSWGEKKEGRKTR